MQHKINQHSLFCKGIQEINSVKKGEAFGTNHELSKWN